MGPDGTATRAARAAATTRGPRRTPKLERGGRVAARVRPARAEAVVRMDGGRVLERA